MMEQSSKTVVTEKRNYSFTENEFLSMLSIPATFRIDEVWNSNDLIKVTVSRTGINEHSPAQAAKPGVLDVPALDEEYWN